MSDPQATTARQIAGIEERTGRTVADFATEVEDAGLSRHGAVVGHLKERHGLTHGHANALAHAVRQHLAGGPPSEEELLSAQYAGGKADLRPVMEELVARARALGDDVDVVVQKTGVSLRRRRQFALVQAPSSRRVQLGLNLETDPPGDRVRRTTGMCSHRADLATVTDIDAEVGGWLAAAYDRAG